MDVRLSFEQQALRNSVAQAVSRVGPKTVADLDDHERSAKLDAVIAASGWRELRTAADGCDPLASAVEAALVAEELARGLADAPFLGPTLAAELRRRAGGAPATTPETVLFLPDLSAPAAVHGGPADLAAVAIDARNARPPWRLSRPRRGSSCSPCRSGTLTRESTSPGRPARLPPGQVRSRWPTPVP